MLLMMVTRMVRMMQMTVVMIISARMIMMLSECVYDYGVDYE